MCTSPARETTGNTRLFKRAHCRVCRGHVALIRSGVFCRQVAAALQLEQRLPPHLVCLVSQLVRLQRNIVLFCIGFVATDTALAEACSGAKSHLCMLYAVLHSNLYSYLARLRQGM